MSDKKLEDLLRLNPQGKNYQPENKAWYGLMIGNSRLHWGKFSGKNLLETWDTLYSDDIQGIASQGVKKSDLNPAPLIIASVVPQQTLHWQTHSNVQILTLDHIPLQGLYPTLGIDRALAVLGAGTQWGWPILVIDAGTALTFTGADHDQRLVGGAILPGFGLQKATLAQKTATLPEIQWPETLPKRWALETSQAIQSGIIYTLLAGIENFLTAWLGEFPNSLIALTGGDRPLLLSYLKTFCPKFADRIQDAPHVIFWGMVASVRR